MKNIINIVRLGLPLLAVSLLFLRCEDTIDLPSSFEEPQLVVDAWLTNESVPQTINLTLTQDFFDNRLPTTVTDAQVVVCQTEIGSNCFVFEHTTNGQYVWTPAPGETLGEVGEIFGLGIQRGEEQYAALAPLKRVPVIDSISIQFEEESLALDEGLYAQVYARDFVGIGDTYFIRSTINDTLLQRPQEINIAFDATFDAGSGTDGIAFIFPIRFGINKLDDNGAPIPLVDGDKVEVDLWSISTEAFAFLSIARDQITNGDNGIFGIPVANSPSNVINVATEEPILGVFNVAAVSSAEKVVEE
ncbi:DUF4249 family protein [Lewinella sp. W8]|uniref:DUF4249 family protein n=1 Tax=Lewinella sp. W8 TaxID=2528208 RepID=UPI0015641524|nr:DUF4249 family protein [Lewinella sp. W8]